MAVHDLTRRRTPSWRRAPTTVADGGAYPTAWGLSQGRRPTLSSLCASLMSEPTVTRSHALCPARRHPELDSDALPTNTSVLGRKSGVLTAALRSVATLPVERRKPYGGAVNQLKARFEAEFARRREALDAESRRRDLAGTDLTMPGRRRWIGSEHPVTRVVDEIVDIFRGLGFTVAVGPEVETDWFNFTALNFPADHPAMDMHDTLYVDAPPVPGERGGRLLLRTHTSPVQIRTLLESPPPVRVVIPGLVYRNDPFDPSHAPAFSQIEGLAVDEGISVILNATLVHFAHRFSSPTTSSLPALVLPSPSPLRRWMSVHLPRQCFPAFKVPG